MTPLVTVPAWLVTLGWIVLGVIGVVLIVSVVAAVCVILYVLVKVVRDGGDPS